MRKIHILYQFKDITEHKWCLSYESWIMTRLIDQVTVRISVNKSENALFFGTINITPLNQVIKITRRTRKFE